MADPELQLHFIFSSDSITFVDKYKTGKYIWKWSRAAGIVRGHFLLLVITGFLMCIKEKGGGGITLRIGFIFIQAEILPLTS